MANINKNIIMQAGAAIANAANKAAGLSAATPEPGSIISVIQLVNGGRTVGPDALAHFTESVRNKLLSLLVSMEPIQDFNGYGHPWPAGGGKNLLETTLTSQTLNGVTYTVNADGTVALSGGATDAYSQILIGIVSLEAGSYVISDGGISENGIEFYIGGVSGASTRLSGEFTLAESVENRNVFFYVPIGVSVSGKVLRPMICKASETDPRVFSPYSNICPLTGRTGANVYVSPTPDVADATTYAANWTTPAGTVYAGSADIVSGDIKAAPYYASYNGETLVGPWVSSMDVYDPEGTPSTGAQVVDLGGTMTAYHITGQDIITFVGDNYIWSDSGDVTITE